MKGIKLIYFDKLITKYASYRLNVCSPRGNSATIRKRCHKAGFQLLYFKNNYQY